jgi:hypothetical protein
MVSRSPTSATGTRQRMPTAPAAARKGQARDAVVILASDHADYTGTERARSSIPRGRSGPSALTSRGISAQHATTPGAALPPRDDRPRFEMATISRRPRPGSGIRTYSGGGGIRTLGRPEAGGGFRDRSERPQCHITTGVCVPGNTGGNESRPRRSCDPSAAKRDSAARMGSQHFGKSRPLPMRECRNHA